MDWKLLFASFSAVFFAELADKTQMVGISLSSKSGKPLIVWLGSVIAYCIVTAVSVMIGAGLGHFIRPDMVKYASGIIFVILGIVILFGKL